MSPTFRNCSQCLRRTETDTIPGAYNPNRATTARIGPYDIPPRHICTFCGHKYQEDDQ